MNNTTTTTANETEEKNHAVENGKGWLINIEELLERYDAAEEADDDDEMDKIRQEINESPLSLQVRSDWHSPGEENVQPGEFELLLSTGGPALRLIGELDRCEPYGQMRLQWQDWGTPWTDCDTTTEQDEQLERFAGFFWYGE